MPTFSPDLNWPTVTTAWWATLPESVPAAAFMKSTVAGIFTPLSAGIEIFLVQVNQY